MAIQCGYYHLWFQSFKQAGHKLPIQLGLRSDQELPPEIVAICEERDVDPFELLTSCNTDFNTDYPEGTLFLLEAKVTDRKGGGLYFYSHYNRGAKEIMAGFLEPEEPG